MSSLTDTNISNTYVGLLHAGGIALSATGQNPIYDGHGNPSSLRLGQDGYGATVTGLLNASGGLEASGVLYPSAPGAIGQLLVQTDSTNLGFVTNLPSTALSDLIPSPAATYTNINNVTVNSKGLITSVTSGSDTSANPLKIVSTTYLSDASTYFATPAIDTTWNRVILPATVPFDAKSVIVFAYGLNGFTGADSTKKFLYTSPFSNGSSAYPLSLNINPNNQVSDDGVYLYGGGCQSMVRIVNENGSMVFYVTNTGTDTNADMVAFHLIAYQE